MKFILIIFILIFLFGCSSNYMEDDDYIYVRKDQVACKELEKNIKTIPGARGGGTTVLETTEKCIYLKTDTIPYYPQEEARKKALKELLD